MMATVFTRFYLYHSVNTKLPSICNRKTWQSSATPFSVSSLQQKEKTIKTDHLEYPLTKKEAISYVENVLKIPNATQKMLENPFQLLGDIQKQIKHLVPFTNVVYTGYLYEGKSFTVKSSKDRMLQSRGGGCFDINAFTKAVLQHLGYDAYLIGASLPKSRSLVQDAHIGIVVQNLTFKGSFHLVEPGSRHPILEPIPLNFNRVSPVYQLIGYPIRIFNDDPGIFKMCMPAPKQKESAITDDTLEEDGRVWQSLITYHTLQPLSLLYCLHTTQRIVTDPTSIEDIRRELFIIGFSGGKLTIIKGHKLIQYSNDDGSLTVTSLELDRIADTVHRHFPQYSLQYVQQAHDYYTTGTQKLKGE